MTGWCSIGTCDNRRCTCGVNQCAVGDACVNTSSVALAQDIAPKPPVEGQHELSRYLFGASLLLASFSALAITTRLLRRGGDDGFVLMNDVEQ